MPAVRYLRLVVLSTQRPFADNSGAMSVAEISAYGTPWVAPPAPPAPSPGGRGSAPAPQPSPQPDPVPEPPALTPARVAPVPSAAVQATLRVRELPKLRALVRRGLPLRVSCATACHARVVVRLRFANGLVAGVAQRDLAAGRRRCAKSCAGARRSGSRGGAPRAPGSPCSSPGATAVPCGR